MKECRKCKRVLPPEMFGREPRVKSGLTSRCLECQRARSKQWRESPSGKAYRRNPENQEYRRKYRATEKGREVHRKSNRKMSETLSDAYIANQLEMTVATAPPELIAMKREQLEAHRLWKSLLSELATIKEKQHGD